MRVMLEDVTRLVRGRECRCRGCGGRRIVRASLIVPGLVASPAPRLCTQRASPRARLACSLTRPRPTASRFGCKGGGATHVAAINAGAICPCTQGFAAAAVTGRSGTYGGGGRGHSLFLQRWQAALPMALSPLLWPEPLLRLDKHRICLWTRRVVEQVCHRCKDPPAAGVCSRCSRRCATALGICTRQGE